MAEKESSPRLSRRTVLKRGLSAGLALFAAPILAAAMPPASVGAEAPAPIIPPPKPDNEKVRADVIPREELERTHHIKILDLPSGPSFVKLDFLKSAKDKPLFQHQAESGIPLHIVLLDGPYISPKFLTDQQKANLPTEALEKMQNAEQVFMTLAERRFEQNESRQHRIYDGELSALQQSLTEGKISPDWFEVEKAHLDYLYLKPTPEQILESYRELTLTPEVDQTNDSYIFMPVRDVPDTVFVSQNGNEKKTIPASYDRRGKPNPAQSYLTVDRLTLDNREPLYPLVGGVTPSVTLRHALLHILGRRHPQIDHDVYKQYVEATKKMSQGDLSDYYIAWETSQGITVG